MNASSAPLISGPALITVVSRRRRSVAVMVMRSARDGASTLHRRLQPQSKGSFRWAVGPQKAMRGFRSAAPRRHSSCASRRSSARQRVGPPRVTGRDPRILLLMDLALKQVAGEAGGPVKHVAACASSTNPVLSSHAAELLVGASSGAARGRATFLEASWMRRPPLRRGRGIVVRAAPDSALSRVEAELQQIGACRQRGAASEVLQRVAPESPRAFRGEDAETANSCIKTLSPIASRALRLSPLAATVTITGTSTASVAQVHGDRFGRRAPPTMPDTLRVSRPDHFSGRFDARFIRRSALR